MDLRDGRERIEFDLEATGAVHVTLWQSESVRHRGEVVFRISIPADDVLRHVRFMESPHVLEGLPAGQLVVGALTKTLGAPDTELHRGHVTSVADQVTPSKHVKR